MINVTNFTGNIGDAIQFLKEKQNAKIFAGGTDLLPQINRGLIKETTFFCVGDMKELKQIDKNDNWFILGSALKLDELHKIKELKKYISLIQAAHSVATPQIRNQGTIGGNILQENRCMYYNLSISWRRDIKKCFKLGGDRCYQYKRSPECVALCQSDIAPVLMSYGANIIYQGPEGVRELGIDNLYLKGGKKNIRQNEILVAVKIPLKLAQYRSSYVRETVRGSFDFPAVSCAITAMIKEDVFEDIRIVFGSAGWSPKVVEEGNDIFVGRSIKQLREIIPTIQKTCRKYIAPFKDTRYDGLSRRAIAQELVKRALINLEI